MRYRGSSSGVVCIIRRIKKKGIIWLEGDRWYELGYIWVKYMIIYEEFIIKYIILDNEDRMYKNNINIKKWFLY